MTVALTAEALRRTLDPADLPFESTAEVEPLDGMISQPPAGEALELPLRIDAPGYNLSPPGPRARASARCWRRSCAVALPRGRPRAIACTCTTSPRRRAPLRVARSRPGAGTISPARSPHWSRSRAAASPSRSSPTGTATAHRAVHERVNGRRREVSGRSGAGPPAERRARAHAGRCRVVPLVNGESIAPEAFMQLPAERRTHTRRRSPSSRATSGRRSRGCARSSETVARSSGGCWIARSPCSRPAIWWTT